MKKIIIPLIALALTACQTSPKKHQNNYILSKSVGVQVSSIYDQYQIGNVNKAIAMAKTLMPKTEFDKAYINHLLGSLHSSLSSESGRKAAISYFKKSVESRLLEPRSHNAGIAALKKLTSQSFHDSKSEVIQPSSDIKGPVVHIAPRYPINAARNGIEGYVVMTFDILEDGDVDNINIVASSPKNVFDKEAKKALERWKYLPAKSKDNLARRMNQEVRLDFQLD
ncbi:energy transducer TonB [Psychrobium sp. nBUS_13]|uniref:energy transducer TonB n=1 Tax=Psychrobium sp. nBUS_13 TaxID=3395319 RepID=UPI003EB9F77A